MVYWEDVFDIIRRYKRERDELKNDIQLRLKGTGMSESDVLELAKKIRRKNELEKRISKLVKSLPEDQI